MNWWKLTEAFVLAILTAISLSIISVVIIFSLVFLGSPACWIFASIAIITCLTASIYRNDKLWKTK